MRRFWSLWFVVAGCSIVQAMDDSRAFGGDDSRTSVFRVLTSEQSERPVTTAPIEHDAIATAPQATGASATQTVAEPRMSSGAPIYSRTPAQMHRPVNIYGGSMARQTMSQFPRRAPIQAGAKRSVRRPAKPFTGYEHEPTLSPYLILDDDEDDTQNVPSYFTQIRPRLEQQQTNRAQQREIQQLRGQLQTISGGGGAPLYEASRAAGMGSPARYMDTAQFYGGMR
jgi:hypothetical protein